MKLTNGFNTLSNNKNFDAKIFEFPFKHLVIDDLFDMESLSAIEDGFNKAKHAFTPDFDVIDSFERYHIEIIDERVLWSFYGKQFTDAIGNLIDSGLSAANDIEPDFRYYKGNFKGIAPHTDFEPDREKIFIGLFYFGNKGINSEGCLKLWSMENGADLHEIKSIAPKDNRFVLFEVSDNSWHSVSAVQSSICRKHLYIPYTERLLA